ncbi:component of the polarisome [Geranomyces michiganensis]|nr:component of the polarisome [Geranomyces michiganensis]
MASLSLSSSADVFSTHYDCLRRYLTPFLQQQQTQAGSTGRANNARDKLARLAATQYEELSIDVFDETNRRIRADPMVPFLPVRTDFLPKRNQARQKLATLPADRFKELAAEVFYELERRFPQIVQQYNARFGNIPPPQAQRVPPPRNMPPPRNAPPRDDLLEAMRARSRNRSRSPPRGGPAGPGGIAPGGYLQQPQLLSQSRPGPPSQQQQQQLPALTNNGRQVPQRGASRNAMQDSQDRSLPLLPPPPPAPSSTSSTSRDRDMLQQQQRRPSEGSGMVTMMSSRDRDRRPSVTDMMRDRDRGPPGGGSSGGGGGGDFGDRERRPSGGNDNDLSRTRTAGAPNSMARGQQREIEELERQKSRLEAEITALRAELDNRPSKSDLARLQDLLDRESQAARAAQDKYETLQYDFEGLQEQLSKLRATSGKEADQLLDDVKQLTEKTQQLREEKEQMREERERDADTIRALREELDRVTSSVSGNGGGDRNNGETNSVAPSTPRTRNDSAKGDLFLTAEDGAGAAAEDPRVIAYEDAAERLVNASRSSASQPGNNSILVAMKSVVIAVKTLTQDAEFAERDARDADDADDIADARARIGDALADLVRVAKDHAAGYRADPAAFEDRVRAIDDGVRDLVDLVRRVEDNNMNNNIGTSRRGPSTTASSSPRIPPSQTPSSFGGGGNNSTLPRSTLPRNNSSSAPLDPLSLKLYIEDTTEIIVSNIQQILSAMKAKQTSLVTDTLADLAQCVSDLSEQTERTMPMIDVDTRPEVRTLLEVLRVTVEKLDGVREAYAADSRSKSLKQRIGNISYEVAKHVKDLSSLFE